MDAARTSHGYAGARVRGRGQPLPVPTHNPSLLFFTSTAMIAAAPPVSRASLHPPRPTGGRVGLARVASSGPTHRQALTLPRIFGPSSPAAFTTAAPRIYRGTWRGRSALAADSGYPKEGAIDTEVTDSDREYMRKAIALAKKGEGKTFPNPIVGCVIVKDGEIVGEGFHPKAGEPHAEVYALRGAGQRAAGATAYVTLEPCNHFGRTPPCSRSVVLSGVTRVVVGMIDPNPLVSGGGIETLRKANIAVAWGVERGSCEDMNQDFIARMLE
mmetsp:Transcript_67077/g.212299  ORF Transcript_67077/g.212299 Transcript_67077/m.212299 type:complete len:271 (+) Transcript_67077:1161-1973(+)